VSVGKGLERLRGGAASVHWVKTGVAKMEPTIETCTWQVAQETATGHHYTSNPSDRGIQQVTGLDGMIPKGTSGK